MGKSEPIEIYDGNAELAQELAYVKKLHAKYFGPAKPFYWTAPVTQEGAGCYVAPSGWYQWQESGLVFLGERAPDKE